MHPTSCASSQSGFILLPVVLAMVLIATIAFLINTESTINLDMTAGGIEGRQADHIAQAGLAHATWGAQNSGCAGDMSMTTVPFGQAGTDSYTATVTTPGGATTPYSLTADQDAWFRSDNPTSNSGTNADMHLRMESGNLEYALYRFDLSPLAAGAQINSASAWLYVTSSGPGGGAHPEGPLTVHRVTTDWTETSATWDTMSTNFDSAVIASIPAQPQDDVWVRVNLTAQLQAWVNGGEPNFGIMLRPPAEGTHGKYVSREGIASQQPRLEVIVGTGPASPLTITAIGTLTGNPTPANDITRSLSRTAVANYQPASYSFLQLQAGSGKDVMVDGFYNSRNHGDYELHVSTSPSWLINTLIQFNLPAIPAGARIQSAQLELYHKNTIGGATDPGATVYRVTRDWVEGTKSGTGIADGATWDKWDGSANWTSAGGDYDLSAVASSAITTATGDWESWDIKTLVQGWVDGSYPNNGLLLKGSGTVNVTFASKENADPTLHPKLEITYACECGSACLAPQGAGKVLMAVINPTTLVPAMRRRRHSSSPGATRWR
jgi:Tfp pilus assembly protein PilX